MDSQTNDLINNEIKSNEVCLFMKDARCTTMRLFHGCYKHSKNTRG